MRRVREAISELLIDREAGIVNRQIPYHVAGAGDLGYRLL
jgi:hypothetical protein